MIFLALLEKDGQAPFNNSMNIKTLADFKRYLLNGGKIQLLSVNGQAPAEKISGIRIVEKMQSNSCNFQGGSWLYFPKASLFSVNKENKTVTLDGLTYLIIDNN